MAHHHSTEAIRISLPDDVASEIIENCDDLGIVVRCIVCMCASCGERASVSSKSSKNVKLNSKVTCSLSYEDLWQVFLLIALLFAMITKKNRPNEYSGQLVQ